MTVPALAARLALAVLLLAFAALPASAERRVALVLGNGAYVHAPPLANPGHDASDLAAGLEALGFEVLRGLDLDRASTERILRDFSRRLAGADLGLFFYAGHGLQVDGVNYLVPVDAEVASADALDFELLRLDLVQRLMEGASGTNVILLDACRDNPFARDLARALGTRSATLGRGLAQFDAGVGTLISFSTQPGNVALDGTGRNSPYTGALVRHLARPGQDLTSLLIAVRNDVIDATDGRQVPWDQHALRRPIHLAGAGAAAALPGGGGAPPTGADGPAGAGLLAEAAAAWVVAGATSDPAVLAAFAARYRATPFADLAEARLAALGSAPSPGRPAATELAALAPDTAAGARPRSGADTCAAGGGLRYCASSVLPTSGVNASHYGPANLFDGDRSTAWVEGVDGTGVGQFLRIEWDGPRRLAGLEMINGYTKSDPLFRRNGRVRALRIRLSNGGSFDLDVADRPSPQTLALPDGAPSLWVEIEILAARKGERYADTAVSALRPVFR